MRRLFNILILVLSMVVLLTACGGGGGGGGGPVQPQAQPTVRELYVVNQTFKSVSVYDASQTGDIAPLRNFGNLTHLVNPAFVAVDTVNNEIFVANISPDSITVYGRTANGDVAPPRTISGASTGLGRPVFLAVTWYSQGWEAQS
ncbi:MAG: hypothetical protein ABSB32_14380 [Thermodesulfobacteriota bacterium]|jgi:hypothetical protein